MVYENKLEFNPSKTVTVVFTKNMKYSKPKIYLNTTELKISNSMLYLEFNWTLNSFGNRI